MTQLFKRFWCLLSFLLFSYALIAQTGKSISVLITNNTSTSFTEHVVGIPWRELISKNPTLAKTEFRVIDGLTNKELSYQFEYKGSKTPQQLLIQVSVAAHATKKIRLEKGKHTPFVTKTFCRYVPERKDDFAWENDRIAFRMYGKALEGTKENANGIDVWVKRTNKMILNARYQRGEYHIDHGDGMDYYHVGMTLGAGNIAPIINDSIYYPANYRQWEVLDNGPLRSTFRLFYDEWNVAGKAVRMTKTISLDAGMQLSRVEVAYFYTTTDTLPVAVGISRRKDPGAVVFEQAKGFMGYWEPSHPQDGTTGVGCIFPQPVRDIMTTPAHFLALLKTTSQSPLIYYTGAAWDKAKTIPTSSAWFTYLNIVQQQLQHPLQVVVL
jgi:hypothetical protein